MKTGVHHSDRPTFFLANINTEKKCSFNGKQRRFIFQEEMRISQNTHVADCCVAGAACLFKLFALLWWFNSLHQVGFVSARPTECRSLGISFHVI
jgi:hypothetical protein